jgi:two-component system chemotaxis response regulator CheB
MIIDDSAFVRQTMTEILSSDKLIEVVATAADPIFAARKIPSCEPDVITLDLEMPRMNGLTFLKRLMMEYPVPVVIISSLTIKSNELTHKAFEYGAVEVIAKPNLAMSGSYKELSILFCDTVKAAAQARIGKPPGINKSDGNISRLSADNMLELSTTGLQIKTTTDKIVVVGASTGGTTALEEFLISMPPDCPGIAIVQHMPELFTRSFAERLNKICSITVSEASHGDMMMPGKAFIAPGNHHMMIVRSGAKYALEIKDGPLINRHRPSVDVLFRSAANIAGSNATGIIMTGMGDDGAKGLLEMKNSGAYTIAQDQESCVVFGMPKAAINIGAASAVLPLNKIAQHFYSRLKTS